MAGCHKKSRKKGPEAWLGLWERAQRLTLKKILAAFMLLREMGSQRGLEYQPSLYCQRENEMITLIN